MIDMKRYMVGVMLVAGTPISTVAQDAPADAMLRCFVEARIEGWLRCDGAEPQWVDVAWRPDRYPTDVVSGFAAGLQRLAVNGQAGVRGAAIATLGSMARYEERSALAVEALIRVYHGLESAETRELVVSQFRWAARRTESVQFLEELVASDAELTDGWLPVGAAIRVLAASGDEGRAALERLHAAAPMLHEGSRALLDRLAETQFRLPPER